MRVIVVGCGRVGSTLAHSLSQAGHEVTVIDQEASAMDNLPSTFRGRTIVGDVLTWSVLQRAEVETADALAGVTNSDSLNALVAHDVILCSDAAAACPETSLERSGCGRCAGT